MLGMQSGKPPPTGSGGTVQRCGYISGPPNPSVDPQLWWFEVRHLRSLARAGKRRLPTSRSFSPLNRLFTGVPQGQESSDRGVRTAASWIARTGPSSRRGSLVREFQEADAGPAKEGKTPRNWSGTSHLLEKSKNFQRRVRTYPPRDTIGLKTM